MARLTRMIATAKCISRILSLAIIRCSLGVAGVGGFKAMCVLNAKRTMKGNLVNDSMIMASERLVREMQKLKLLRNLFLIHLSLKVGTLIRSCGVGIRARAQAYPPPSVKFDDGNQIGALEITISKMKMSHRTPKGMQSTLSYPIALVTHSLQ